MNETLKNLAEKLSSPASDGYLQRSLPCELDVAVTSVVDDYIAGTESERATVRAAFDTGQSFGWLVYAERMASLALRTMSRLVLLQGLVALIIEGFRLDARENIPILSLLNRSAEKMGIDPSVLFNEATRLAPEPTATQFKKFSDRSPDQKSINAMGYQELESEGGLLYIRKW